MATPAFRSVGTPTQGSYGNGDTATTVSVALPTCQTGDLLVLFAGGAARNSGSGAARTFTAPSGWAQVTTVSSANDSFYAFSKTAVAGDSGSSITVGVSGQAAVAAAVAAYSGGSSIPQYSSSPGSLNAPTVTTTTANTLIVESWVFVSNGTPTAPAISRAASASSTGACFALADQAQASPGTSNSVSASSSGSTTDRSAITLAIAGNQPPNAPTLNSPANNQTIDRTAAQQFTWTFSDPDTGDSQSQFDLRYTTQGGTYPSTPQVSQATPSQNYTFAANTFTAGTTYQWQVRTYDSSGTVGPWSAASFFTAQNPPATPTITSPTSGSSVQAMSSITWSTPTQTAYQVQKLGDSNGTIDPTTVYYDSGTVADQSNSIRTQNLTQSVNNRYEWWRVRVQNNGLWSAYQSVRVQVSFTPPPQPTAVITTGQPNPAAMSIAITNPAPASGAPAATSNVVLMSPDGGTTVEWSRGKTATVAPNATVVFYTPASGVNYSYCIIAQADNGTTSTTGWITPTVNQVAATGGTVTDIAGYRVHQFTSSGTFTVTQGGSVEYLIVAGGGGGSGGTAGGGGAGGLLSNVGGTGLTLAPGAYTITVGAGGTGAGTASQGGAGQNSTALGLTAIGGGAGANTSTSGGNAGGNGGSGGGAATYTGSSFPAGSGTTGQGNAGAAPFTGTSGGGSGGGGAGGTPPTTNRNGGPGAANSITGASVTYAGGGGGAGNEDPGTGGVGGGGNGSTNAGSPGTANTGGGGGAGWTYASGTGGAGGSGVVIIRYPTS